MSETNYMSRGTNCANWHSGPSDPSGNSFETCSAACIADAYCIGIRFNGIEDNKWHSCTLIYEDSLEDCPDGDDTVYPKDCQCPLESDAAAARGPLLVVFTGAVAAALAH